MSKLDDYHLEFNGKETMCQQIANKLNQAYNWNQHNGFNAPHMRTSIFQNMEKFNATECSNLPTFVKKINQEHITGQYTKSPHGAYYHLNIKNGVLDLIYEFL